MTSPKFKPGQSGNPNGRPKDKTPAALLRKSIIGDIPAIINTLVELAKGGDVQAAKVLLDRVCPTLKPQAMPISLPVNGTRLNKVTKSSGQPCPGRYHPT